MNKNPKKTRKVAGTTKSAGRAAAKTPTVKSSAAPDFYLFGPSYLAYVFALLELNVLEGPVGTQQISAAVQPLFDATHKVLAGGQLAVAPISVTGPVDQTTVDFLNNLLNVAVAEINVRNSKRKIHPFFG